MTDSQSIVWLERTAKLSTLRPFERNPRKISKDAFENLKRSLAESGYHQRIICQPDMRVIDRDVIVRRWQEFTGNASKRESDGAIMGGG